MYDDYNAHKDTAPRKQYLVAFLVRVSLDSSQLHEVEGGRDDAILLVVLHCLAVVHDLP